MGSYAIRSTPDPIQSISLRKPAPSFENRDARPSGAAKASSQSLEMSIPTVQRMVLICSFLSCACRASLDARVSIQDAGKDGGPNSLRPLTASEANGPTTATGRFWLEAPRLSPPQQAQA